MKRFSTVGTILVVFAACGGSPATTARPTTAPTATTSAAGSPAPATNGATPAPSGGASEPWVVYQWAADDGDGLYLVRPDGSDNHRILTDLPARAKHPDWSPDGKQIAFLYVPEANKPLTEIWTANADGTGAKKLIGCADDTCVQSTGPAWSPDGSKLAFARWEHDPNGDWHGDRFSIIVADLATLQETVIARSPEPGATLEEFSRPRWSPDGKSIVFAISTYQTPPEGAVSGSSIAIVSTDGSDVDSPRVLPNTPEMSAYPDWSPSGDRIIFDTYDEAWFFDTRNPSNIYSIHPDGSVLLQLTAFRGGDARAVHPTYTPDGREIVFTHIHSDKTRWLAYMDADGSHLTNLPINGMHPRQQPTN